MKTFLKSVVAGLLAALLTVPAAFAQDRRAFTPEELDQMLAPIALYPDPLLSQILMAATYPLEVVQAARWSRANSHLKGQDAARAVEPMDWDPSVKSLVAFPQILHRMDEQLDWTQRVGEAFLEQEPHVMDAIQGLRQRAERAGNLRSNEQMRVTRQDEHILIEPAHPQVVYVPYYNPAVVYGPWWWPAYPPVYWGPPPGYYAWPAYAPGFFWGSGIVIGTGFFFGHFSWPHRHVIVHHHPAVVVVHRPGTVVHRTPVAPDHKPLRWQHDPHHRKGVPYRHATLRQPFGKPTAAHSDERSRPVARRESHNAQPGARSATPQMRPPITAPQTRPQLTAPQTRPQLTAPQPRPELTAPQARDRLPERNARMDIQRPQSRAPEARPAAAVPHISPVPRPVAPPPVARAEPRSNPPAANTRATPRQQLEPGRRAELRSNSPAANTRAIPRQQLEPGRRAEPRNSAREIAVTPRAAAAAPTHVPRATGSHASGGTRAHDGGNPRAISAGRGGGRS